MMRVRLCLALTALLAILLISAASADVAVSEWQSDDWDCSQNTIHPGVPILIKSIELDPSWDMNGGDVLEFRGPAPDPNDPDVSQTIRNRSQTAKWTDWHVELTNGTYRAGTAVVYNLQSPSPLWVIEPYDNGHGFFAHVVSGMDTQVDYYEQLSVFFSYDVDDPNLQVSIKQYPTDTYAIPEPASILALFSGLLGLGFGIRRKP